MKGRALTLIPLLAASEQTQQRRVLRWEHVLDHSRVAQRRLTIIPTNSERHLNCCWRLSEHCCHGHEGFKAPLIE